MKKKSIIVITFALIVLLTGCTKYLSDDNKKRVINEKTGQAITSNILCLPESKELKSIYEKYKEKLDVDYDKLSKCKNFKPSDISYNKNIFEVIFVKPLAWLIIKVGGFVKNYGLAVMILGILIRLILIPFTKKSMMQSENMKKAQPELQAIQKKYGDNKEQAVQMSQEMMLVYKKYGINPAGGCLVAFIQLPILLAFLEAINRVPAIFEGYLFSLQLGTSPSVGIKNGNLLYIVVIVLIIVSTYFSYKNTMNSTSSGNGQEKQMKMMMIFMIVFISIASLSLPTALALYWIVSNVFMIVQNLIIQKKIKKNVSKGKVINKKNKR